MGPPPVWREERNIEDGLTVRFLLWAAMALLFLWLGSAQTASAPPCEASPGTALPLLLAPLSLYSWLTSALAQLLLAAPALVLTALHQSLLLLLAGPWALLCFWGALALGCLQVLVYLLHLTLALALGVVVSLTIRTKWKGRAVADKELQKTAPPGD
ncbi:unnamed protein product [Gadus morhua 'NCC']